MMMIRRRQVVRLLLLCSLVVWCHHGLAADDSADAPPAASDVRYFSKFDGTPNRDWEVEREIDPKTLTVKMEIYEVTRYPYLDEPTEEQRKAAESLRARSLAAARKHGWTDFNRAVKDGFHVRGADPTHFRNDKFVKDNRILDPDHPEYLLYYDTTDGRKLAGFMYLVRSPEESGPQVGGPLTIWHYHVWAKPHCMLNGMMWAADLGPDGTCPSGELASRSPEMIHVWFVDRPDGAFASRMALTPHQRKRLADLEY